MSNQETMTITGNDVGTLKIKKQRGPKPGSKRRPKSEIVTSKLEALLAIAGGSLSPELANAAELIKQVLAEKAATSAVSVTSTHPRLAEIRSDRKPLKAARRRFETLTRHLAELQAELDKRTPFIDNVREMVDYYDRCEAALLDAIKAGHDVMAVKLPDRPNFAQETAEHAIALRQSKQVTDNDANDVSENETEENSDVPEDNDSDSDNDDLDDSETDEDSDD